MSVSLEMYLIIALIILYIDVLIILKLKLSRLRSIKKKERLLEDKKEFIEDWSSLVQIEKSSQTYQQLKEFMNLKTVYISA